ncbi:MAG: general stress protein [Bacillota bacterium]
MSKAVIGVFSHEDRAKEAINDLKSQGFGDREISLIAKDKQGEGGERDRGDRFTMERQDLSEGVISGGALGGIAGILAGAGALLIPGVGPIIAAGPLAAFLTGVVGGGIVGGLVDYGIPEERGRYFENRVKQGDILVTIKVEDNEVDKVTSLLKRYGAEDVESH